MAANQPESQKADQTTTSQQAKETATSPDSKPTNAWQLIDRLLAAKTDLQNDAQQIQQNMALVKSSKAFLEEQYVSTPIPYEGIDYAC
jgi:hypothetical protein